MPAAVSARSGCNARHACRDRWPASTPWVQRRRSKPRYPSRFVPKNRRSGRRQQSGKLLERLVRRIGALSRRRIDELVDVGAEIDHDFFLMLIAAVEHYANDIVLAGADLLER